MANKKIRGITIELDGNATKLGKALESVQTGARGTQSELKEVERLLKLDPKNTELLTQKQKILKDVIAETKEKLDILKTAEGQVQEQFERGEISEAQYRALQREIEATELSLKRLEDEAKKSSSTIANSINNAVDKISEKTGALSKKLAPVSAAAAAVGTVSVKSAMSFEDAMAKVSTIADTTKVPLENLQAEIVKLSDTTGESAADIADAVYNAISAGQDTGDAVNFVSAATTLAKAGFTDTAAATDILTTALNAYGLEASEVTNISDMLITTQNLGKTTVNELASAMGKVIPTANSNNVSFSQLGAAYAQMTARGIATAESTTYLNGMLNELGKSGTKVDEIIREETGKGFSDLMADGYSLADALEILNNSAEKSGKKFSDLWSSSEAGKAAIVLLGDSAEDFNNTLKEMEESAGATETAYGKLDTTSFTLSKTINQAKNIAIDLGTFILEILQPAIQGISEKVSKLKARFNSLSDSQKEIISKIIMIVAVAAPALLAISKGITLIKTLVSVVGTVKKAITALHTVIAANPIAAVIIAISALIAGIVYLYNKCEWFREAVNEIFNKLKDGVAAVGRFFADTFKSVSDGVKKVFSALGDFFKNFWREIKETFTDLGTSIADAIGGAIKAGINGIIGFIEDTINSAIGLINGAIKLINKIPGVEIGTIKELDLPKLAKGGVLSSGSAIVAEAGPELIQMVNGKTVVTPLTNTSKNTNIGNLNGENRTEINLNIENFYNNREQDISELTEEVLQEAEKIRGRESRAYA